MSELNYQDPEWGVRLPMREHWLTAAACMLEPKFIAAGLPRPRWVEIVVSWDRHSCVSYGCGYRMACAYCDIDTVWVSPMEKGTSLVLGLLVHELCHLINKGSVHGRAFHRACIAMLLEGPARLTYPSERFKAEHAAPIIKVIGEYPSKGIGPDGGAWTVGGASPEG